MVFFRLNVTSSCNFTCKYCHAENYYKNPLFMDFETMDTALGSMIDNLREKNYKNILVSIYGGEPFLNKINLFKLIEKYKNYFRGIHIGWIINTNGTLIKKKDVKFLKRYDIDLHISCDGPREIHDLTRRYKNGGATFDSVIQSLKIVKENKLRCQINTYCMPENLYHLRDLVNIAFEYNVDRIYLDWFHSTDEYLDPDEVVHEYLKVLKYGEIYGVSISGPWKGIFLNYSNGIINEPRNKNALDSIELDARGFFFFRFFPLTRNYPLRISKLKHVLGSEKAYGFLDSCNRYFKKKCLGCILEKYCFGSAIVQSQYHLNLEDYNENICELTQKLVLNLVPQLYNSEKPEVANVNIIKDFKKYDNKFSHGDLSSSTRFTPIENFIYILFWLKSNSITKINFMDYESFLHPEFEFMLNLAKEHGFSTGVYFNGLFNVSHIKTLVKVDSLYLYLRGKNFYSSKELKILYENIKKISSSNVKISIIFCLEEGCENFRFLVDFCNKYEVEQVLINFEFEDISEFFSSSKNEKLKERKKFFFELIVDLIESYVRVQFYKTLPLCLFTEEEKNFLFYGCGLRGYHLYDGNSIFIDGEMRVSFEEGFLQKSPRLFYFETIEDYNLFGKNLLANSDLDDFIPDVCINCCSFKLKQCHGFYKCS